jgi:hypothetical protein
MKPAAEKTADFAHAAGSVAHFGGFVPSGLRRAAFR